MENAVPEVSDSALAEQALRRRFEVVEQIAILQGKHKGELEPLLEEQKMCEVFIKDFMNTGKMQQYKIDSGDQAFFQNGTRTGVENHEAVLDYIVDVPPLPGLEGHWDAIKKQFRALGHWGILTKAVKKEAVVEYVEVHQIPPPGTKIETFRDLQWRKGKGGS